MKCIFLCCVLIGFSTAVVRADAPAAAKYIEEAKKLADEKTPESRANARKKLELAELELDGVSAEAKKPLADSIDALRKAIDGKEASADQKQFQRELERILNEADSAAGNLVLWPGVMNRFNEFAKKKGVAEALGKDLEDARKRIDTMAKLYKKNKLAETVRIADEMVLALEKTWSAKKTDAQATDRPEARDRAVTEMEREITRVTTTLKSLPDDHATRKALEPRVGAIATELRSLSKSGAAGETARRLKDSWELDSRETTGWETESANVTFDQYSKESSEKMSAFGAPRTVVLLKVAKSWLKNREGDRGYETSKDATEVKAIYDVVQQSHAKGLSRMEAAADAIVAEAAKTPITDRNLNAFERLVGDLRSNLGDSPKSEPLQAAVQKLLDQRKTAAADGEKAKTEWYATMTRQAVQQWPELKKKYSSESTFDPQSPGSSKGKLVTLTTDNLMGYRFKPGDFPFATTLNGHAIAAKFDPVVTGAIEEVQKKLGRDLGDNDDDGKWEIVFRVEGTKGKMLARKHVEGDIKLDGRKIGTYEGEYSEPTEAAIVTIVAAKCGPLAVSTGEGMVNESGEKVIVSSQDPKLTGDSSTFTGYGLLGSILRLFLGLLAGTAALILGGFAPLVNLDIVKKYSTQLTFPLGAIGLMALLYGLIWLTSGRGILASFCWVASGVFIIVVVLQKVGVLKADSMKNLQAYGVPLGFACITLTLISIVTQGRLYVI